MNYNSGDILQDCLLSVLRSTVSSEIIVVDNCSIDHSLDVIEEYRIFSSVKLIRNPRNLGFSAAVNKGAKSSVGEYLLILNPDCVVSPHALNHMALHLQQNSEAGVVGGLVFDFWGVEQAGCRRNDPSLRRSIGKFANDWLPMLRLDSINMTNQVLPDTPLAVDAVSGSFFMARRETFNVVGGMDEGYFLHFEDLDFCRKVRESGSTVMFLARACAFHQKGGAGRVTSLQIARYKHVGFNRYFNKYPADGVFSRNMIVLLSKVMFWAQWINCFARHTPPMNEREQANVPASLVSGRSQVLVLGGRCDVGEFLLPRLSACGYDVIATSRTPERCPNIPRVQWINPDYFGKAPKSDYPLFDRMICLLPLWELQRYSEVLTRNNLSGVLVFSSSSVLSKSNSKEPKEKQVVSALIKGETWLVELMHKNGVVARILRPTMIYGGRHNRNVNRIKKIGRTLGILPMVKGGVGKRQPVHADDISELCVTVLNNLERIDLPGTTLVAGGEVLSHGQMVTRVIQHTVGQPRIIGASARLLRFIGLLLSRLPGQKDVSAEMVNRTQQDLVYPGHDKLANSGFCPRRFYP